ncbi:MULTISPECIES: helix-turn-helix domain-containing protein [Clostridium]|uniref:helix-turn-helix domain-containing protein n=1 Tax=Clostridium TaxID=1485 RepID=UPI000424A8DD|nr:MULTISPECIES: helix-turn-helix transcriptional regulator [Clostridium]DAL62005.1 MAG TPA_asm: helix-turn-helix domain protein [Caudoviricetes sp.]KIU07671.1 transcriptional regulator, Cro/CI family [Clostridium butyricum]KJZ83847.1 Repressor [Clostridium sp. IBUN125C]KJZ87922.1 Periplasmic Fe hydrogenase [Clostridium sp. IBUN13A]KJZ93327.1 Repressor [Clostridium sp. IBUN62F]
MIEMKYILKGLREQKQISMDKMCEDLNNVYDVSIAKSTISKWENGKAEPSLANARILTKYFNVTLDYLLGLEKEESYNFNKLSKEETTLLENYNKLNALGKKEANKRVAELTEINRYLNTITDEITATKDNMVELNNKKITYDDFETVAAHNDNLTDDEISEADRRILADINKRNSK